MRLPIRFRVPKFLASSSTLATASSPPKAKTVEAQCPDHEHPINFGVGLEDVADDIHYLILSELSKSSLSAVFALAHSSKALRGAALPFIYRNLVLKTETGQGRTQQAYQALIKTFRHDEDCQVAKHVRCIVVKDEIPEEDLMLIFNKISECGRLHKLSWETSAHMPMSVFDKLRATWPDLDLSVRVLDRQSAKNVEHRQMDMKLLSSPLLRTLIYTVHNQGNRAETPARSEWPKLTRALVAGGSVRVLLIQSQPDGSNYRGVKILDDSEPEKLTRLDITPETRLPALEELIINVQLHWSTTNYLWDTEHCEMLRDAMNCSSLRKLDFGTDSPEAFFTTFTGLLPNLRALRFGLTILVSMYHVNTFIESLTGLESLDVSRAQLGINEMWPSILMHKNTLRELILRPTTFGYGEYAYIDINRLQTVAKEFPSLERLGWDVPFQKKNISAKHLSIVSTMNLTKLDLFLHLPVEATAFSTDLRQNAAGSIAPPPIDKAGSKKAAMALIEKISEAQKRPLERLTLHFTRTGYEDRAQPYLMQGKMQVRLSKEYAVGEAKYEVRGKGEWYGLFSLNDELELEDK